MPEFLSEDIVEVLLDALERPFLGFALNTNVERIAISALGEPQRSLVAQLDVLVTVLRNSGVDAAGVREWLRNRLPDVSAESQSPPALQCHVQCGGVVVMPEAEDAAEIAITILARDLYASYLLPSDDFGPSTWWRHEGFRVSRALFSHPANRQFQDAVMEDPKLSALFGEDNPASGRMTIAFRSTYSGSSLQLWTLAGQVLRAVWVGYPEGELPPISTFIEESLQKWRFIRRALAGGQQSVRVRMAFAGVRIPAGLEVDFRGLTLRQPTDAEYAAAPEMIKDKLTATDDEGNQFTINYQGDVVVEATHPYIVRAMRPPADDEWPGFPPELIAENPLEDISMRLRLGLVLGVHRTHRIQITPTWRTVEDPLDQGNGMSWQDPKQGANISPAVLSLDDVEAWKRWYVLLSDKRTKKLALAISRVVKAIGERQDPVDVLIDSVIVWENLFGSKEGEPTLRVTSSLALLLESEYENRRKLRTKLGKIYALRSDAVHGTKMPTSNHEIALCHEALDIAIQALQVIIDTRPDLLDEADSTSRSLRLILGGDTAEVGREAAP